MNEEHLKQAEEYPTLGPHYFAARDVVDKFMEKFVNENLSVMVGKFSDEFYRVACETFDQHLLNDVSCNLQNTIWHQIDESVKALLSGERWALERYALGERYDHEKIRAAIARHIPNELRDKRIDDLEAEVKQLKESLRYART